MSTKQFQPFVIASILGLLFSSCTGGQVATPTKTLPPTVAPTIALTNTAAPTATVIPIPGITLRKGDFYFSIDGHQNFIFSRNLAGFTPDDFSTLLTLAHEGGTILVRVGTDNQAMGGAFGYGYTHTGEVRDDWSDNWEHFVTAQV